MISLRIRPAVEGDRDGLARVMLDSFQASYATFMPRPYVDSWHKADTAQATVSRGIDRTGVAEQEGCIRGFATTEDEFLAELWVCPTAQGNGIGATLVKWAEDRLLMSGHQTMSLYCYGDNRPALAFYERLGFRIVKTFDSKQVAGGPVPVCILSKSTLPGV